MPNVQPQNYRNYLIYILLRFPEEFYYLKSFILTETFEWLSKEGKKGRHEGGETKKTKTENTFDKSFVSLAKTKNFFSKIILRPTTRITATLEFK